MGQGLRVIAVASAAALLTTLPAQSAVIIDSLLIRVYDTAGILAADRTRAIRRAADILARAEVGSEWRDCSGRGRSACSVAPLPGELVVRLVRAPKLIGDPRELGSALIDSAGYGTLATVFVDRVDAMAQQASADRWSIVGRVMAHEIGHLLLGTHSHSDTGLMREMWTLNDLTRDRKEDWLFSRAQRERLHESLAAPRGGPLQLPPSVDLAHVR